MVNANANANQMYRGITTGNMRSTKVKTLQENRKSKERFYKTGG